MASITTYELRKILKNRGYSEKEIKKFYKFIFIIQARGYGKTKMLKALYKANPYYKYLKRVKNRKILHEKLKKLGR
nr:MAG: hypothetical protein [Bacteriophage sp.]